VNILPITYASPQIQVRKGLVELLSKEYRNRHLFRRTVVCVLQVRKCSSSYSVRFFITEKEGFTEKVYGHTICALLFFTTFV